MKTFHWLAKWIMCEACLLFLKKSHLNNNIFKLSRLVSCISHQDNKIHFSAVFLLKVL